MESSGEINKDKITRRYLERTEIQIALDIEEEYVGKTELVYLPNWILEYIGIDISEQLSLSITKLPKKIFNKFYNKNLELYEFNLNEMLKDDKINKELKEIDFYDVIFNAYKKVKTILNEL